MTRERLKDALREGLIHETGLIAHGRGEAFDYLMGEQTPRFAKTAARIAAAALLSARRPVLSCNGNVVALAARECVEVAQATGARLEVNLFHRTEARVERLVRSLQRAGGRHVLGPRPDARIPGLESDRAKSHVDGSYGADVVLVPLEDGDRALALRNMRKTVIAIDLNPLSRTAVAAHITIVDELTRALPLVAANARELRASELPRTSLQRIVEGWDNRRNLLLARRTIAKRLAG